MTNRSFRAIFFNALIISLLPALATICGGIGNKGYAAETWAGTCFCNKPGVCNFELFFDGCGLCLCFR
jgi:hypothetical protein